MSKEVQITHKGEELVQRSMTTESKIVFTKITTSATRMEESRIKAAERIEYSQQTSPIHRMLKPSATQIQLQAIFSNTDLQTGYNINTVGIFARLEGEDTNSEILYAVLSQADGAYMPAYNGKTPTSFYLKFNLQVGSSEEIKIVIDDAAGITHGDLLHIESVVDENKKHVDEVKRAYDDGELKGDKGDQGVQGIQGEKGDRGIQGGQGEQGIQGSLWYNLEVDPSSSVGRDGDYCINTTTSKYFKKEDGAWSLVGDIKGEKGDQGVRGITGTKGDKGEKGETGDRGRDGSKIIVGSSAPSSPNVGDFWIDSSTYELNERTSSTSWTNRGNIKGEKGERGYTGSTGARGATGPQGPRGYTGPSGASGIHSSGSNINGEWIKFDDGTMICRHSATSNVNTSNATGSIYCGEPYTWTYPAMFSYIPSVSIDTVYTDQWATLSGTPGVSSVLFALVGSKRQPNRSQTISYIAIGRWK